MRTLAALLLLCAADSSAARWLKLHSLSPHKQRWNAELVVVDFAGALPKVVAAVEDEGGRLVQPLEVMAGGDGVQQASLTISARGAARLEKALRRLGALSKPRVTPVLDAPDPAEIRDNLALLLKEKTDNAPLYARLPAASQAVDEIIAHLTDAQAAANDEKSAVLWNLTVRRK